MNSIPVTGLTMKCEYCGFERPVPNAAERKRALEAAERERKQAEERARKQAERERAAARKQRRDKRRALTGWLRGLWLSLIPFVIIGVVTYFAGLWEPLIGDSGEDALEKAVAEVESFGYEVVGDRRSERTFSNSERIVVDVEEGCYAVVIGAGKRLERVETPGAGKRAVTHTPRRFRDIVYFCTDDSDTVDIGVTLESMGRLAWALMVAAPATEEGDIARFPNGCAVRSNPSAKSRKVGHAEPAVPYRVIERKKKWRLIEIAGGERGWATCATR